VTFRSCETLWTNYTHL